MEFIAKGDSANDALVKAAGIYGRFADSVTQIDPRHK
jgi:hypothetical protein